MTEDAVARRLRHVLLWAAAAIFVASAAELVLVGHYEDLTQQVPFGLCGAGLVALLALRYAPRPGTVKMVRWIMGAVALGGFLGLYKHAAGNWAFAREVQPGAASGTLVWDALSGGNPLFAPGILLLAAFLAAAATWAHPSLEHTTRTASGDRLDG